MDVKHPEVEVQLSGEDGNAMMIVGRVAREMRRGGVAEEEIIAYRTEALSGDYDNVLQTSMRWVTTH